MQRYLLIAVGGALGAMLRFAVGDYFVSHGHGPRFPLGTFTINISACFLLGLVVELLNRHAGLNPGWRYLIPTGFIGAYSTFSTFEWEIVQDLNHGALWWGMAYLTASIVFGLVAVALGANSARAFA